jgi:molybdopterin synthase catalytic subunit
MAQVTTTPFDPYAALKALSNAQAVSGAKAGALASFIGLVRASDGDVAALRLDHYPAFTARILDQIEADASARFDVQGILIIHRAGAMLPGEPIVLVAATSAHRKVALACVDYLMDRLKTEAPFWKLEIGPNQSNWIEPRASDYQANQAWNT